MQAATTWPLFPGNTKKGKRQQYCCVHVNCTSNPAVRETARRRFEEKDLTFKSFAKYKLTELLKRRVTAMESQEKRDREGNPLAFLQSDDLVSGSVEKLTVEVFKGAVVTWQQSNPHIFDLLRRHGTKEALMRQFEELYGQ